MTVSQGREQLPKGLIISIEPAQFFGNCAETFPFGIYSKGKHRTGAVERCSSPFRQITKVDLTKGARQTFGERSRIPLRGWPRRGRTFPSCSWGSHSGALLGKGGRTVTLPGGQKPKGTAVAIGGVTPLGLGSYLTAGHAHLKMAFFLKLI